MQDISAKTASLMAKMDWSRPELAKVKAAPDQAKAFVEYLAQQPRPRFRVEYTRKAEMLDYLRTNYAAWRNFDLSQAKNFVEMDIAAACKTSRSLANIATLGQAWWFTANPDYVKAFSRFYLETKTGELFNWGAFNSYQGSFDLDAYVLMLDCPDFTAEARIAILDHVHAITDNGWDDNTSKWDHLMLGAEGHNWYLHGIASLAPLGFLFPEFKRSAFFLRTAASVMEEHLRGHYKEDGGARETSLGYQIGSVSHLWDFYLLARRNGYPLSSGYSEKLLRATKFLLKLMTPDGRVPSYGDCNFTSGNLTKIAAMAAALSGDEECKWHAEYCRKQCQSLPAETPNSLPYSAFWAIGLEGAQAYESVKAKDPRLTSVLMGPTGFAALRNQAKPESEYMAIAAMDLGYIVNSHSHANIFSLEVHAHGQAFMGEPGCVSYGTSPGRNYDQKTEAHNCLTVGGKDQVAIINEWRWSERVSPCIRRWISENAFDYFHGVHEGYYHQLADEAIHARKVFFAKEIPGGRGGYWIVLDRLIANKENDYAAYFHGVTQGTLSGKGIMLNGRNASRLAIIPPANDELKAEIVKNAGLDALIAEKRLKPEEYPCFAFKRHAQNSCLAYALVPLAKGEETPEMELVPATVNGASATAAEAIAVRLNFKSFTDWLCISHKDYDAEIAFGPYTTWGHLAFRRVNGNGEVIHAFECTMAEGSTGR